MDALRLDIRHALRRLAATPGFTVIAVLTLALGIGANTAIFTVVNAIILKPLPYDHPEELGRRFRAEENEPGKHHVVILSHALWLQRFGGNRDVVGRTITIDAAPHTVVGVMPAGFSYPEGRALWVPFEYDESFRVSDRGAWFLDVIGRLRPGVSARDAARDVAAIARRLERQYPKSNTDLEMTAEPCTGGSSVIHARRAC